MGAGASALGVSPGSATDLLCDLGQVPSPFEPQLPHPKSRWDWARNRVANRFCLSCKTNNIDDFEEAVGFFSSSLGSAGKRVHLGLEVTGCLLQVCRPQAV